MSDMTINTNGAHANGVFSYGEGTTVNISNSKITTSGNCSGALMTTGGGTMNATNVTAKTSGNSSATIRSDRGGGTVTVNGGNYKTSGKGSPTIYSTADSYVSSLTCDVNSINLNGHTLYVNGVPYSENTASIGNAITINKDSSQGDKAPSQGRKDSSQKSSKSHSKKK